MKCPWCEIVAGPRALHAHFSEWHADQVRTGERNGKVFYEITCPECGQKYEHLMRKAARDPEFVEDFGRQIRMVAFDMLVHHLLAEHPRGDQGGRPPETAQLAGDGQTQRTAPGQSGTGG